MENLTLIFSFIGKNVIMFVKSALIKFVVYMSAIVVTIIYSFSMSKNFEDKISILLLFVFVILIDYSMKRWICLKRRISILIKFTEVYLNKYSSEGPEKKYIKWKNIRREIRSGGGNRLLKFFTGKYTESIGVYSVVAKKGYAAMERSRKSFAINNLTSVFTEFFINLIFALPFFVISILFTSGYRFEFVLFTLILALIFVMFIRSALISPVFLLLTHKKILDGKNN